MANQTLKLGLRQPQPSDPVNVQLDVNSNMDIIDKNMNFLICTSATRPNPAVAGRKIFETDTGALLIYTGTEWRYLNPGAGGLTTGPQGKVFYETYQSNITGNLPTSEPVEPQLSVNFDAVINRYYWSEIYFGVRHDTGTGRGIRCLFNCRIDDGLTVTSASPQLGVVARAANNWASASSISTYSMWEYLATFSGTKTIGFFWWMNSDDAAVPRTAIIPASSTEPVSLLIRDVGGL